MHKFRWLVLALLTMAALAAAGCGGDDDEGGGGGGGGGGPPIKVGWPQIISSLKTLLETGAPLPA